MTNIRKPKICFMDNLVYEYSHYRIEIFGPRVEIYSASYKKNGLELSQWLHQGYLDTYLGKVHKVVAESFLGPRPPGTEINHIDGNKLNNHPSNLEYITKQENLAHSIKMGLHVSGYPERNGNYKDGRALDYKKYKKQYYLLNKQKYSDQARVRYLRTKEKMNDPS